MKRIGFRIIILLVLTALFTISCWAQSVIPGGNTIGLRLQMDGVTVVEFSSKIPERAGLCRGDIICAVNGKEISTTGELTAAVEASGGAPMVLEISREGEKKQIKMAASQTEEGLKLGIFVRDRISGIGTVTYIEPETGHFGALGHGITNGNSLLPMKSGDVFSSQVASVTRGEKGTPGALQGVVMGRSTAGEISQNTPQGIFGTLSFASGTPVEIAEDDDIHTGPATIRSNVRGTEVEEFQVRICAVYPEGGDRNLLLKVVDSELLRMTGGIVQGMGVRYNRDNTGNP